jgi:F-type H+-transporting ATPase subunit b
MQNLDVISVNLWQILISLANLVLLFLIVKHFLFKPVKRILAKRQQEIDGRYDAAHAAQEHADENRREWETAMATARTQADGILQTATEQAKFRGDAMVDEARQKADSIIRMAQTEAELERKKAEQDIKREIVEVSGALTAKMLGREINDDDHRALIDSFLNEIGDANE